MAEIDMERFKKARAKSIWDRRGGDMANKDAIKALRVAIVDECRDLIKQHIAQIDECKAPQGPIAVGGAIKALEKAREALEGLKK